MTQTPVKNTDGTTIESQPRLRHANWTWSRIWTRYRYGIITVIAGRPQCRIGAPLR